MKEVLLFLIFLFTSLFLIRYVYSISVDLVLLNVTNIDPGKSFEVKANVTETLASLINDTNITCVGPGGQEWVESWDSYTLLNDSVSWNVINTTTIEVTGIITLNTSSINGSWTCKVYARNSIGQSTFNSNSSLTVNTYVGLIVFENFCGFEAGLPGDENKNFTCEGKNHITFMHDGNVNISVKINGTNLVGTIDTTWEIGVGNITYKNVTSGSQAPSPPGIPLSTIESELISYWDRGIYPNKNTNDLYCWLNYPVPLKVQTYQGTIYLIAREA
ncbi:MAG: hypothetical protein QW472_04705 [Candidatus Aenigmatarchaeota archaeon]